MKKNLNLVIGLTLVGLVIVCGLLATIWTPADPSLVTPDRLLNPSPQHLLGTDDFGRDIFSRILSGAKICLLVGVVAVAIGAVIGVPLGIVAALRGGIFDTVMMRIADIVYAFPALLLAILLAAAHGSGTTWTAMLAIGIATIPAYIRITRSATLQVLSADYMLAARACGTPRTISALTHVLPNVAPTIIVQSSVSFALAILAEAALSYLGLGTPATTPTWGLMLFEAQKSLVVSPNLAIWPALSIAIAVLGFNLLGDGMRQQLDPKD